MTLFTVELEYPPLRRDSRALAHWLQRRMSVELEFTDLLESGGLVVRINCPAVGPRQAVDIACELVDSVIDAAPAEISRMPVIGIRAKCEGEYARLPPLAGIREIAATYNVTAQRASVIARKPGFPLPVAELRMGPVYIRRDILRYKRLHANTAAATKSVTEPEGNPGTQAEHQQPQPPVPPTDTDR